MCSRHCFVVLGLVVRLLEGSTRTVSQSKATSAASPTINGMNLTKALKTEATSARINGMNLTKALKTEATSARPTSLLRRIDLRKADYNVKHTRDIFLRKTRNFRRNLGDLGDLWRWDYWCMLQPQTGNCGRNRTKYYYNAQVDHCFPLTFTGCNTKDNKNEFESLEECTNHCKGSTLMPVDLPRNTDICKLQPISGRCLGNLKRYYYDANENQCKTFMYGGCAGNDNNFEMFLPCLQRCNKTLTPIMTQYLPEYDYEYEVPQPKRITPPQ